MTQSIAVVSAADDAYFYYLKGLVCSIQDKPESEGVSIYVVDAGLTDAERDWLNIRNVKVRAPRPLEGVDAPPHVRALLSRCDMPAIFPGHDVYIWMDADTWVQQWGSVQAYVDGALEAGLCLGTHVDDESSGGVFALRAEAPHWDRWRQLVKDGVCEAGSEVSASIDDVAIIRMASDLPCVRLGSIHNWLCAQSTPVITPDAKMLLEPKTELPLGIVHMNGDSKRQFVQISRTDGVMISRLLTYEAASTLAEDDYVSPNLTHIMLDPCFPNMIRGNPHSNGWPYLRRWVRHAWYVDQRTPLLGFLSRDEAHIVYNTALKFAGKPTLEIGCLLGWSSCHLTTAGVKLDIIDPILADPGVSGSVQASLCATNSPAPIVLTTGRSPEAVEQMAADRPGGWSLFFIDGSHDRPAPLLDATVCARFAAPDALMLFHDLASPEVAEGVLYLKEQGWNVRIYHTAQIMAAAWRGNVTPVEHQPDPRIVWQVPDHLRPFYV